MLLGTHTPKLDEKGRVILPAKFRDDLGPGVVVTRGQERCLYVFSTVEFERVYERIRETLKDTLGEEIETTTELTWKWAAYAMAVLAAAWALSLWWLRGLV